MNADRSISLSSLWYCRRRNFCQQIELQCLHLVFAVNSTCHIIVPGYVQTIKLREPKYMCYPSELGNGIESADKSFSNAGDAGY